jgi:hypothetical protein
VSPLSGGKLFFVLAADYNFGRRIDVYDTQRLYDMLLRRGIFSFDSREDCIFWLESYRFWRVLAYHRGEFLPIRGSSHG